jgi:hypothetical protein
MADVSTAAVEVDKGLHIVYTGVGGSVTGAFSF